MNSKIVLMAAWLLAPVAAFADGGAITLREAINRALAENNVLKAVRFEQGAALAGIAAARTGYFPRLNLETGAVLTNSPSRVFMMKLDEGRVSPASDFTAPTLNSPSPRGDFHTVVSLEQPLWDPRIGTSVQLAAKEVDAATTSLDQAKETIAFRVYQAYLEVRRARAMRTVSDQAVADAKEHNRLAAVREKDGVGLRSDGLRAATELSEAEQRQISSGNDLKVAQLRLNLIVGGPSGKALDTVEEPKLPEPGTENELLSQALENRRDLKGAEQMVEKGELSLQKAKDAFLPNVYASASYQINDHDLPLPLGWDHDSWSLGVNLRWEIFDASRAYQREKARDAKGAAAARLEETKREVALQVTEGILRRTESGLRLESARRALKASEEGVRLVSRRFENGLSAMVELMDAEAALNRSRAGLVEAENGYALATAELYYAAGIFRREVLR